MLEVSTIRRNSRRLAAATAATLALVCLGLAVEGQKFRLLSITESSKMILVSEIPSKTKYVLDASSVKIMVDGKPAEFQELRHYTVIHVKFEPRKGSKDGIPLDGVASEIRVSTPENRK